MRPEWKKSCALWSVARACSVGETLCVEGGWGKTPVHRCSILEVPSASSRLASSPDPCILSHSNLSQGDRSDCSPSFYYYIYPPLWNVPNSLKSIAYLSYLGVYTITYVHIWVLNENFFIFFFITYMRILPHHFSVIAYIESKFKFISHLRKIFFPSLFLTLVF